MHAAAFDPSPALPGYHLEDGDWVKKGGAQLLRFRWTYQGFREVYAGLMEIGKMLQAQPRVKQALLVTCLPRVNIRRLTEEWQAIQAIVRPEIFRRMGLMVIHPASAWVQPRDAANTLLADELRQEWMEQVDRHQAALSVVGWGAPSRPSALSPMVMAARRRAIEDFRPEPGPLTLKGFEVFKVLLAHWCRNEGPVRISDLIEQAGVTYPTGRDVLLRLARSAEILRTSNRSVGLSDFPQQVWAEVLTQSRSLRKTMSFVDTSGKAHDSIALLKRLVKLQIPDLAVGGVVSARHWDPDFDLNGTPRLDLVWHVDPRKMDYSWIARLDPALKRGNDVKQSPAVVIHFLERPKPLFEPQEKGRLPVADPVETLLDLYEMRLVDQAEAMIEKFRKAKRE